MINETESSDVASNLHMIERELRWIASWMIHNANQVRRKRDGLKVGGHQASCASIAAIMTALYFYALRPQDKVAVKPHASPVLHAIHFILGSQSLDQLIRFREFGGAQSYPSRTKDVIPIDFSTGSVGLGVAITAFSSLVQDYLLAHGDLREENSARMIALLGDAELDEGNIYECLIEAYKHRIRNCWWIVDFNRQSLDSITADRMFRRFDDIFETCGWRVITLKYGKLQKAAFSELGGQLLEQWIENCSNVEFAALTYQGGSAWRSQILSDLGHDAAIKALLDRYDDDGLSNLMTNLGGHCIETLMDAFDSAADDTPTLFIAYTVKGFGLPIAGHKDNHSGMMTTDQIVQLRSNMGKIAGKEWEPFSGLTKQRRARLKAFVNESALANLGSERHAAPVPVPAHLTFPANEIQSTQSAFGNILLELAKTSHPLAHRIVTTAPDVTQTTNLGGFVNQKGLFRRDLQTDVFRDSGIPSAQKWVAHGAGQHIELGIAENNFFLLLASLGLSASHFGSRLFPIGTVYDPFIARGLDALNYACYQDARFLLVGTPSGVTLGPEGGAHQSISTPLIGIGQPNLMYFEPAWADELALIMRWAFEHMQLPGGSSVYLRLSTAAIPQVGRTDDQWQADAVKGGYWIHRPSPTAEAAIVFTGAVAPEAFKAYHALTDDIPGLGLLNVTSPDLLHRGWSARHAARSSGKTFLRSHAENLLSSLPPGAGLVTIIDGAPGALSWLGSVNGRRVSPLGVGEFGQSGDLPDLYRAYRLDAEAIIDAAAELFLT